jgi:hypothetical protein
MAIILGSGSKLQVGTEATWGTKVTPTVNIGYVSESMKFIPNYKAEDTLVGAKTTARMDLFGRKAEGDVNFIVHPENIGWWLWYHFGTEGNATASGSAYTHAFTHVAAGAATSLPKFTMVIDKGVSAFAYTSCKSDTMKLSCKVNDYLRAAFTLRAYTETSSSIVTLADSTTKGLKFSHGNVTIDGSAIADITGFDLTDSNNLENDLYVMNGSSYMVEIEPQGRSISATAEVNYSSAMNVFRDSKFIGGATCSVILTFTSDELAAVGSYYALTITMPNCYWTEMNPSVSGPDRIKATLNLTATHQLGAEPITVTVKDARATKYSA